MKILGRSKAGNMLKLESDNPKGFDWYFMTKPVMGFSKNIPEGADIDIETEEREGETYISRITLKGGHQPSATMAKNFSTENTNTDNNIRKQVIGKCVAETIKVLQGQVDINNIGSVIDILFKKYEQYV